MKPRLAELLASDLAKDDLVRYIVGLQLCGQPQLVVHDDILQVVEAAFEVVAPDAGALQTVGGADIEHQEAVSTIFINLINQKEHHGLPGTFGIRRQNGGCG